MNDKAAMATSCAKAARARLDSIILRRSLSGGRYATRRGAATGKAAAGREAVARLKQDQHWARAATSHDICPEQDFLGDRRSRQSPRAAAARRPRVAGGDASPP